MAKIFLKKILNEETNPHTNEVWVLEDVPMTWRDEVENLLRENQELLEV